MNFWSWTKKRSNTTFAVVEIGSSTVSGALFAIDSENKDKSYHLISSSHAEICARDSNITAFLDGIKRAFNRVADDIEKKQGVIPAKYYCILSSPFYVNHIEQVVVEKTEPFVVTEKMVLELANKKALEVKVAEPLLYANLSDDKNIVIESKVMQILLNDYEITNPFGKETRKLSFFQFISLGSEKVSSLIKKLVKDRVGREPELHSFAYCEYNTLRDLYHFNDNFLVVDVGGEITDLTTVTAGRIVDSAAFSMGQNFLTKWLVEAWPTSRSEITSILRIYLEGKAETKIKNKIETLLERIRIEWINEFKKALGRSAEHQIIPAKIFLIGNGDESKIFRQWISAEDLSDYTLTPGAVAVDYIDERTLTAFFSGNIAHLDDTFLLVDALFCGKMFKAS